MKNIETLYYPHISINDPQWIRSQLLYFDKINIISPFNRTMDEISDDEEELIDKGIIARKSPVMMNEAVVRASKFVALLLVLSKDQQLKSRFSSNPIYKESSHDVLSEIKEISNGDRGRSIRSLVPSLERFEKDFRDIIGPSGYARIDSRKVEWRLRQYLSDGKSDTNDDFWIDIDPVFSSIYMTCLAREMSHDLRIGCVTKESIHDALFQDLHSTFNFDRRLSANPEGALVDIIMASFKISPEIEISKIIKFREKYKDELARFRSQIYTLSSCVHAKNEKEIRIEAEILVERVINPAVRDLESALSGYGIVWNRSGIMKAASMLIPAVAGIAAADYSASFSLGLATAVTIGVVPFVISGLGERAAVAEASPYAYLLDLNRKLSSI